MLRDHVGTPVAASGGPDDEIGLDIDEINQEETLWCWAACISMVIEAGETDNLNDQCDFAKLRFTDNRDCCSTPAICNSTLPVDWVAGLWQPSATPHCRALSFDEVRDQLADLRPVQIWVGSRTSCQPMIGSGHLLLAVGCFSSGAGSWLVLLDPAQSVDGRKEVLLEALETGATEYEPWVGAWTGLPQVGELLP